MATFDINKYIREQGGQEPVGSIMSPDTAEPNDKITDFYKRFSQSIYNAFEDKERFNQTFGPKAAPKQNVDWDEVRRYTRDADMRDAIESSISEALGILQEPTPEPQGMTLVDVTDTEEGKLSNPQPLYDLAESIDPGTIETEELPPISSGLMSPQLDQKGKDPATTTIKADDYLRNKNFITEDDTLSISAAISGTDFKNRNTAIETIGSSLENAYSSPTTAQAIKTTIESESGSGLLEKTNYSKSAAISVLGGGNSDRIARINALYGDRNRLTPEEQEQLFNIAYGGRMGNAANEGYKYRGRGLIQITGKNNYRAVGEALGIGDALVDNPDLLLENPSLMLAATDAYLTVVKGMNPDEALTANGLKDLIGHSGDAPRGFNGTGSAYEGMQRWNEVIESLEAAGKQDEANEARLNNEFAAQQRVGVRIDGDIGPRSIRKMTEFLRRNNVQIPEGASAIELVRLVNGVAA